MRRYEDVFTTEPLARAMAPGRVNMLGEHTDYNDGFVLPAALRLVARAIAGRAAGDQFVVYSANLDRAATFTLGDPPKDRFALYVYGCVRTLVETGTRVPPLDLHVAADVPIGVGLSSSAALEVAVLRVLRQLAAPDLTDLRIAQLAQQAEVHFAGVHCGIMDQMASSLGGPQQMLFIDTRSLAHHPIALPEGSEILVMDSGIARSLAGSAYNSRRGECEAAASALGVRALRDIDDVAHLDALPPPLQQRARHVVTENARVVHAAHGVDATAFGALMNTSHASLRDDFEVSTPLLDRLVAHLAADDAVFGARLTGAGFGGACVALCAAGEAGRVAQRVLPRYAQDGGHGRLLVPANG